MAEVTITGLRELERKLQQLPKELVGKGASGPVAQALRKAGVIVLKDAIERAPIDEGDLKKSIRIVRDKNPPNGISERFVIDGNKKTNGRRMGFHYLFVELGTIKAAARPFLRPALINNADAAVREFKEHLGRRITAIGRKLGRQR